MKRDRISKRTCKYKSTDDRVENQIPLHGTYCHFSNSCNALRLCNKLPEGPDNNHWGLSSPIRLHNLCSSLVSVAKSTLLK